MQIPPESSPTAVQAVTLVGKMGKLLLVRAVACMTLCMFQPSLAATVILAPTVININGSSNGTEYQASSALGSVGFLSIVLLVESCPSFPS